MEVLDRRAELKEGTRRAILDAARASFTSRGYADTSTEDIVRDARVTRGALYYHFADKRELFAAVLEELEEDLAARITERALGYQDVWTSVIEGTQAFLDACLDPSIQRIMLLDGPAVLGWERCRTMAHRYGVGLIRGVVERAMDGGIIDRQPVEALAHALRGAMHEGAMHIARAADVTEARDQVGAAITRLLEGLRTERRGN